MKRKKKANPEGLQRGIRQPGDKSSDAAGIWAPKESSGLSREEMNERAAQRAKERFERVRKEAWQRKRH